MEPVCNFLWVYYVSPCPTKRHEKKTGLETLMSWIYRSIWEQSDLCQHVPPIAADVGFYRRTGPQVRYRNKGHNLYVALI